MQITKVCTTPSQGKGSLAVMRLLGCLAVIVAGPRCADLEGGDNLPLPLRNDTLESEAALQGVLCSLVSPAGVFSRSLMSPQPFRRPCLHCLYGRAYRSAFQQSRQRGLASPEGDLDLMKHSVSCSQPRQCLLPAGMRSSICIKVWRRRASSSGSCGSIMSMLLSLHLPDVCCCLAIERGVGGHISPAQRLIAEEAQRLPLGEVAPIQPFENAQDGLMRDGVLLIGE